MTIDKEITLCGRSMYLTEITSVVVLLLKSKDEFIMTTHLETEDMVEETLHEADVRAVLNTIELSLDKLYKSISV